MWTRELNASHARISGNEINVEVLKERRRLRHPNTHRFESNFGSTLSQLGVHITSATAPLSSWQRQIDVYSKHHNFDDRIFSTGSSYLSSTVGHCTTSHSPNSFECISLSAFISSNEIYSTKFNVNWSIVALAACEWNEQRTKWTLLNGVFDM